MRKYILLVFTLIFLLFIVSCNDGNEGYSSSDAQSSSEAESAIGNGTLIINGTQINTNIEVFPAYAKIPLLSTLEGLGAELARSEALCEIKYADKTYILDISSKTLALNGESTNILPQDGAENYVMTVINGDLVLDDVSLYKTLDKMGISIRYNLDFDELRVEISLK